MRQKVIFTIKFYDSNLFELNNCGIILKNKFYELLSINKENTNITELDQYLYIVIIEIEDNIDNLINIYNNLNNSNVINSIETDIELKIDNEFYDMTIFTLNTIKKPNFKKYFDFISLLNIDSFLDEHFESLTFNEKLYFIKQLRDAEHESNL